MALSVSSSHAGSLAHKGQALIPFYGFTSPSQFLVLCINPRWEAPMATLEHQFIPISENELDSEKN